MSGPAVAIEANDGLGDDPRPCFSCLPQVAALRSYHYKAQTQPDQQVCAQFGLDLVEGRVRNNVEEGVLEPAMSKIKMIQVGRVGRLVGAVWT